MWLLLPARLQLLLPSVVRCELTGSTFGTACARDIASISAELTLAGGRKTHVDLFVRVMAVVFFNGNFSDGMAQTQYESKAQHSK